jgi:sn-glycerol 3-phosphate transport system ATP-binding protein
MATLTLEKINKSYKDTSIIKNFNLEINDGEFIVIVGPSGCGKSTLLRMVAGLEEITKGTLKIDDKTINNTPPGKRNIAMVFQNYALYPHMNVYKNMAYGLKMRKFNKTEIDKRVNKAAKLLELKPLLKRKPGELSGGQRQRVAMGRAIVRQPDLFLFDEPLSNLDAKLRVQMRTEIKKLQKQFKTTSLYVTHDQVEAMTMADRLVVLNKGKIEQIGSPLDIYEHPASTFVGAFIGSPSMNFLDCEVSKDGRHLEFWGGSTVPIANPHPDVEPGQLITIGFRPEHIRLAKRDDVHHFRLTLNNIEILGADTLLYGTFPNNKQQIIIRLSGKHHPKVDDELEFEILRSKLHYFDPKTKKNLITNDS